MTTYKLTSMTITNFKGIENLEIDFTNTDILTIYAANGIGKSTIADAHFFLFTGKDSIGRKNFDIRPYGLDTSVNPIVEESYNEYTDNKFTRSFSIARGVKAKNEMRSGLPVYCGDTTYCSIDGIDCKTVKEFESFIASLIPEVPNAVESIALNLLTDPSYLTTKIEKNDEQRKIILSLFGELSEKEFIDQMTDNEKQTIYNQLLAQKPTTTDFESWKQSLKKKDIDKQIADLNSRIDEQYKSLANIGSTNQEEVKRINSEIAELDTEKEKLLSKKSEIINGTEVSRLKNEVERIANSINALDNENSAFRAKFRSKVSTDKQKEIEPLTAKLDDLNTMLNNSKVSLSSAKAKKEIVLNKNSQLVIEFKHISAQEWTGDIICPTCNRPMEEDSIEEARKAFNENKVKQLSEIQTKGEANKAELDSLEAEIQEHQNKYERVFDDISNIQSQISGINKKYADILDDGEKDMPNYQQRKNELMKEKEKIDAQKEALKKDLNPALESIKSELENILSNKQCLDASLLEEKGKDSARKIAEEQIAKHKADLTSLVNEKSENERKVSIITDFQMDYYSALQNKLNENFTDGVRFRLFNFNKTNGEFKNQFYLLGICENTGKYRLYSGINTAQQYKTNLALLDSISRKIGVRFPVFMDNAERVTANFTIENQMIVFRAIGQKVKRMDFVRNDTSYQKAKKNFIEVETLQLIERNTSPMVSNSLLDDESFDLF